MYVPADIQDLYDRSDVMKKGTLRSAPTKTQPCRLAVS